MLRLHCLSPLQTKEEEIWSVLSNSKIHRLDALDFIDATNHLPLCEQHSAEPNCYLFFPCLSKLEKLLELAVNKSMACLRRRSLSLALESFHLFEEVVDGVVSCRVAPLVNGLPLAFSSHKIRD